MQRWAKKEPPEVHVGSRVKAVRTIQQVPPSVSPAVPRGSKGFIDDWDRINRRQIVFFVDFG